MLWLHLDIDYIKGENKNMGVYGIPAYSTSFADTNGVDLVKEDLTKRGLNVYTASEVVEIAGRGKNGQMLKGTAEVPLFGLSIWDRITIAQKCDAVYGVVTGRMKRIAGLDWSVQKKSKDIDRIEIYLKQCKQLYDEYANAEQIRYRIIRTRMIRNVLREMPDCLPDLSNFSQSMVRWKKRIEQMNDDKTSEIEDWLNQPNAQDNFDDLIQKWVHDLCIHGGVAAYKEKRNNRLESLYILPGGTVEPLKPRFVGPVTMYAQIVPGMDPKIYFRDEIMWSTYMPTSGITAGLVPLEALVNKVAETLFFDQKAAEMADGTVPPEKIAVFGGEKVPFGSLNDQNAPEIPLEKGEQSRLETLLNEPRKNAIRILSGYGTPNILDLSRSEIFKDQSERQRFIRETVAFVFNASNMEVNLTGSSDTSGRSTSETQESIEREKGIYPIVRDIENDFTNQILPDRYGYGYTFNFKTGLTDSEQAELDQKKMATGTYGVNEIRVARGDEPLGPEFDNPQSQGQSMQPDGSTANPLNIKSM